MPVLSPGPTSNGLTPKNFRPSSSIMPTMGGTTQETMMASMASLPMSWAAASWAMSTPYSSTVRSGWVTRRQWVTSSRPR